MLEKNTLSHYKEWQETSCMPLEVLPWHFFKGKKVFFLVQLHVTNIDHDKDGDKHCVAYDGVSVRDNFQYAKVKLVEESDRNDPLNEWEVFSSLFKGQIAQKTKIHEMKIL